MHICAEVMSFNDQTHGAEVINESAIVTAIGHGISYEANENFNFNDNNDE